MKKKLLCVLLCMVMVISLAAGCSSKTDSNAPADTQQKPAAEDKQVTILVAAAASLKNCLEGELKDKFEAANPNIKISYTFDSSGKLQKQIEEGADVDVFMSAAKKQMDELNKKGMILQDSIVELLENKIVLIMPKDSALAIADFKDILQANKIAVGDPESVPAGQYAKEAFDSLGMWDQVKTKASLGTNVTEVLNWVAEGSADAGVVYATDAAATDKVKIVAEAPEGSVSKVIYPVGIVNSSTKKEAAAAFQKFLKTDDARAVFVKAGFTPNF